MSERTAENTCANCAFMDDGQPCEYHLGYQAGLARTAEKDLPYARHVDAYVRGDGTGFFMDCPRCHFYKNSVSNEGDPCRSMTCTGTVERVSFRILPSAQTSDAKETR